MIDLSVYHGTVKFADPETTVTIGGVVITKDGVTYRGETVADAGAVHRALLEVLTGVRQLPVPIAHLRWWACQRDEGHGNIGHGEGFEVCEAGAMSDDKTPAFPVYAAPIAAAAPIPMILHCPQCHTQHIDAPDERTPDWDNPPHRSHLCHGCGHIWRPADVPTEGVRAIQTKGSKDSAPAVGGALVASINQADTAAYWPLGTPSRAAPLPDGWLDDYITNCAKLKNGEMPGVYFVEGVRFAEKHFGIAAPAGALVATPEPLLLKGGHKAKDYLPDVMVWDAERVRAIVDNAMHASSTGSAAAPADREFTDMLYCLRNPVIVDIRDLRKAAARAADLLATNQPIPTEGNTQ